jgi:hypothetical protein
MGSNYVLDVAHNTSPGSSDTDNDSGTYFRVLSTVPWVPVSAKSIQTLSHSSDASSELQASLQGLTDHAEKGAHENLIGFEPQQTQWKKHGNYWSRRCDSLRRFRYPIPVTMDFPTHILDLPTSLLHLKDFITTAQLWCVLECASADVDTGAFARLDSFSIDSFNADSFNTDISHTETSNIDSSNMDSFNMNSFDVDIDSDAGHTYAKVNIYQSHKYESSLRIGTLQSDGQIIGDAASEKGKRYCDFVAISELCARGDDEGYIGSERGFSRYVNVLWDEKVRDFCYLRGLGRIYKSDWLKCATQEKVLLG